MELGGSLGAEGREPRLAQRRVILFFWPMRASSLKQFVVFLGDVLLVGDFVEMAREFFLK